jgi:spore maturation protein CgeB
MRIFLVIGSKAASVSSSNIYCDNVYQSLQHAGYDVVLYNFEKALILNSKRNISNQKEFWSNDILEKFNAAHNYKKIDVFFSFIDQTVVYDYVIEKISTSVYTINYTTNFHQFNLIKDISKKFNLNTYISLPAKKAFDAEGVNSYWMPMAANPRLYRPSEYKKNVVSFVGTSYGNRPYYLWRLLQLGVDLKIYGPHWRPKSGSQQFLRNIFEPLLYIFGQKKDKLNFLNRNMRRIIIETINKEYPNQIHDALSDEAMIEVLAQSELVINIPESRFNHDFLNPNLLLAANFRDFEVPMSGSCLVTQFNEEIIQFYEPGVEVLTFSGETELADKILYYSTNLSQAREIARNGLRRALAEHTWESRFDRLFKSLHLIR